MRFSIIVPMLNEAPGLPGLLARLTELERQGCEILIVDGGSDDGSVSLAERAGFRVLASQKGRARQMNLGAAQATGDVLLFLHADTLLPEDALTTLRQSMQKTAAVWGRFDVLIDGAHPMLRVIATLMNHRSRWTGIATGDQAIFVTRKAFNAVGGYPDQPLMEDIELSNRLRALARPACIPTPVRTSGRRWESRGVWRTVLLMWRLRWAYWRGTPAEQLAQRYR
ncbi:MAG: glycosyl transferase [Burkholderiales bacterium RIFCSPHIGHO2_02_FULL_66_10]|jgi:rSAM/selenodomain-associated transferase 2|uniref:TIGR04283 family arsenosugar biosynthesis glycosyltransferase n=1 Tax=Hydrogenophaga sp. TaxID=1904254 RepID=UPI0008C3D893|nr:TIGR04283 family arsenosugar biosynthesis glycosyltransferase [Hydrogenophaga sp.]MBU4182874.1 TIGR04283 family arsenosugar biosynthesis glycosyltransferase [Gammaproteobacteria bacterium]OGB12028.1 MAG: glycosyl transferase [Burkholderiales bacterium RIFCSPHIGHO2_02_FULL_66_10]OGB31505.1 MAG: glycosyl transferase [Burkholderiales bacterium RIFCSPLOWO2_02_FULL_66_35]MBU4279029.1 TIGR04283 family arsenosugar biosynthesis glycosyltransferase [Gammaproteobacteria bacterium]MBU4322812.1 TIGR042